MELLQPYIPNERDGLKNTHRLKVYCSSFKIFSFLFTSIFLVQHSGTAQNNTSYKIFERTPLSQLQIPQPASLTPAVIVSANPTPNNNAAYNPQSTGSFFNNNIQAQNQRILQMDEAMRGGEHRELPNEVQQDMREFEAASSYNEWLVRSQYYRKAYNDLLHLNPDSFSITQAVFIVENAWSDNKYSYRDLQNRLKTEVKIVRQILKNEKLDVNNNMALNYAIQKRFKQGGSFYDTRTKSMIKVQSFKYDFTDYMGKKDYRQMFVSKLLLTGKGQCHSMPLGYLMIAEQMGAKAWLSLAPEHSFIRFMDAKGNLVNFETTNSNLVSNNWLTQSSYITAQALQNKIYLDTLSQRQLYAQVLSDLLMEYLKKFNYDGFAHEMHQRILSLNPKNMSALLIDAGIKRMIAIEELQNAGMPPEAELPKYPAAYRAYTDMAEAYQRVDDLGYQQMPPEAYQAWLKSVETEKQKQEQKAIQQQVQKEIRQMKMLPKSTLIHKPKD
jgi:hypothetical protein